jgi:hypothetical protein
MPKFIEVNKIRSHHKDPEPISINVQYITIVEDDYYLNLYKDQQNCTSISILSGPSIKVSETYEQVLSMICGTKY